MTEKVQTIRIAAGIDARISDQSNRYYGDFHRVFLKVSVRISRSIIADRKELAALIPADQSAIEFTTSLEQMAVPTENLATVRESLIHSFINSTRQYLRHPSFIENLIKKQYR